MSCTETAGIEILQAVKKISPDTKVIMLTKNALIKSILNAMKRGAYEFIEKPVDVDKLNTVIQKALDNIER